MSGSLHRGRTARSRAADAWSGREQAEAFNLPEVLVRLAGPDPRAADDAELTDLFEQDQGDRYEDGVVEGSGTRDLARRRRAMELLALGRVRSPRDYYHLAMVLQHSGLLEHYHLGFELARRSAAAGFRPARWLAAAALDRWLLHRGLPQRYGTQYVDTGGRWRLYRVDPATTDEERIAWDVPPLADALRRAEEMNGERPGLDEDTEG
ncbi:hypothetical protein [Microbispora siamensis]|uniref:DUF4240 domain-containing protein n=1 Tax=Microbispora siamensis TaxID=564413 RepID=A0ABQ4GDI9_9ACTN|nr:hypothetical protein [Microbispora siamensis]GIH59440.1 hypothetical protein Msi02_02570 [Microbispora siamensis]